MQPCTCARAARAERGASREPCAQQGPVTPELHVGCRSYHCDQAYSSAVQAGQGPHYGGHNAAPARVDQ